MHERSTNSGRPATQRKPRIPFPDLPPTPAEGGTRREIFWRAAWLRDLATLEALAALQTRKSFARESAPLQLAIVVARSNAFSETRISLNRLIEAGGLLYAWAPEGGAA